MDVMGSVLLALAIPIIWGLASAWAFDWLRERFQRKAQAQEKRRVA
jgi:hypothetical protein